MAPNSLARRLEDEREDDQPAGDGEQRAADEDQEVAARRGGHAAGDFPACIAGRAGTEPPFRFGAHGSNR